MKIDRRQARLFVMAPIAAVSSIFVLIAAAKPQAPCDIADQWATAHADALPRTYEALIAYPEAYRKAIYVRLPRSVRQQFWLTQFDGFLEHRRFSPEQRAFVMQMRARVPAVLADPKAAREIDDRDHVRERAIALFGDTLATSLFARLGPADPPASTRAVFHEAGVLEDPRVLIRFAAEKLRSLRDDPLCDCATDSDFCGGGNHCSTMPTTCTKQDGCGLFLNHRCDGLCYKNLE